jgi:hypothetical protein
MSIDQINKIVIAFDKFVECCGFENIIVITNMHIGLTIIYLMFSNKLEKYYLKKNDETFSDIVKNNLMITIINQAVFMMYIKFIILDLIDLDWNLLRIAISLLYSITQTIFFSVLNDYVIIAINFIFSFIVFMMYLNFDELTSLYINIFVSCIQITYYLIWKMLITRDVTIKNE